MSRDGLIKKFQSAVLTLPAGLLAATLYAIACWMTRQVSLDQFFLPSGIRVAALLATPARMWPYLLLGEYAYFAEMRIPLVGSHGLDWVLISSAYQFPLVALIVHLHRHAIAEQNQSWMLSIAAMAAFVVGAGNLLLMHAFWTSPPADDVVVLASRFVLGHYVAILTVAPVAVMWCRRNEINWSTWRDPPTTSATASLLALGVVSILIPQDAYPPQGDSTIAHGCSNHRPYLYPGMVGSSYRHAVDVRVCPHQHAGDGAPWII